MIVCNGRILRSPLTGIQRYTQEVLAHLPEPLEMRMPPLWFKRPYNLLWEQSVLPLHCQGRLLWSPANAGPLAVRRQVITVHDLATLEYPQEFSKLFTSYFAWLFPRLLPRVSGVITVSEYTRQRVLETFKLSPDQVTAIPLGVDHARFHPQAPEDISALKTRLKLPEKYILFVGTLSIRKNVSRLIDAWRLAQNESRIPADVELVIAGGGIVPGVFNGVELPPLPPRTRLIGRVSEDDLPVLMAGAAVLAYPSLFEGFGLPPLEAMACGTPCVVSNVTSLPEVVGDAAISVDPLSVEAIAGGLTAILSDAERAADLSRRSIARAATFRWHDTAQKTWQVLSSS